ncbi:hypothetical protein OROGR_032357 [Orobanche gracilis]
MVAMSLYKGNLHKVPNVPRRWQPPTPKISLEDFKILLHRRARALSRLRFSSADASIDVATSPSPSPRPSPDHINTDYRADNAANNYDGDSHRSGPELLSNGNLKEGEGEKEEVREEGKVTDEKEDSMRKSTEKTDALMEERKNDENVNNDDKSKVIVNSMGEKSNIDKGASDAEKRKKEVKEKFEILNQKKHGLVQVLKQILNAEEQLKRRNSTQGMFGCPPLLVDTTTDSGSMTKINTPRVGSDGNQCSDMEGVGADYVSNHNMHSHCLSCPPLQVDTNTDSGSMTKVNTQRVGLDGNPCSDMEGVEADDVSSHNMHSHHLPCLPLQVDTNTDSGSMTKVDRLNTPRVGSDGNPCSEADDVSNHNMTSRHLPRSSSTSPSSDCQHQKPDSSLVPHSCKTTMGIAASPSRSAPVGQGYFSASYLASSPSPAASGGTSVFRDGRTRSPWN